MARHTRPSSIGFREIRQPAEKIAIKLGVRGPVNIQAMRVGDEVKVFEINPRFSATCPMRAVAGINEPDIVLRNIFMNEKFRRHRYKKLLCMRLLAGGLCRVFNV